MDEAQAASRASPLAAEELDAQAVVDLPPREALSLISTDVVASGDNVAIPTNEATAVNYNSNYSVAIADADQVVIVEQTSVEDAPGTDNSHGSGWGRGGRR